MSTLPPALAHVLALRGFAWADELRPDPYGTGTLPILTRSGSQIGTADLPLLPDTAEDTFSLFDEIAPLTDQHRTATLVRLEYTELAFLIAFLPVLDGGAWQYLLAQLDEDDNDASTTLFTATTTTLTALTRKERTEILALLRSALQRGHIEPATIPSLRVGIDEIQALRDTVFRDSIRFAASVVRTHRGLLDWSTALLAACQGLEDAIDRFEPARGFQFSTYAHHWIRQRVGRHRSNQQAPLRLPVHLHESIYRYIVAERTLWTEDRRPTIEAVLEALGTGRPRTESTVEHLRPVFDAHLLRADSSATPFAEHILDSDLPSMWDGAAPSTWPTFALRQVEHALSTLGGNHAERQADILRERLALCRPRAATLQEMGTTFNVSRERIRQLQVSAIGRLKLDNLRDIHDIRPWRWRAGS
jgi:RNA polymerase sigma factor (sigma-70 family)